MNTKFAVNNMANAINDIIIPKFRLYLEDRKSDPAIQAKINARVKELEAIEDIVTEIQENVSFKDGDSISIGGSNFYYSKEKGELVAFNKVDTATNYVYYHEGLSYQWNMEEMIRTRILAIISGLWKITFPEALALIEDQIDFAEFINLVKANK